MCLRPRLLRSGPSQDNIVPCGSCAQCLQKRSREWTFRLEQEAKFAYGSKFLTLTYAEDKIPVSENGLMTLYKKDYQDFMKRLRWNLDGLKIRYYACGEYGTKTYRPHYHAVVFGLPKDFSIRELDQAWQNGITTVSPGNIKRHAYVSKYITKGKWNTQRFGEYDDRLPEFSLMSKGLGKSFLTERMKRHIRENETTQVMINGYPHPLPRYFREKVYEDKQQLAIVQEKLQDQYLVLEEKMFKGDWHKKEQWQTYQQENFDRKMALKRLGI